MKVDKVILASGSPRRRDILKQIGVNFEVVVSNEEEKPTSTNPLDFPIENASIKALSVSRKMPSEIVLGFDTLVFFGWPAPGKAA